MGLLSLRGIYSLDTLDTRFTTPATVPYSTVHDDGNGKKEVLNRHSDRAKPSKWKTPEFIFYYLFLSVVVPYMFWIAYSVSRPEDPRYYRFEAWLSPGWIPGRKIVSPSSSSSPYYEPSSNAGHHRTIPMRNTVPSGRTSRLWQASSLSTPFYVASGTRSFLSRRTRTAHQRGLAAQKWHRHV